MPENPGRSDRETSILFCPTNQNTMAEIRIRNAEPELIAQLEAISAQLKEATITGTLEKMIPRYHDLEERVKEQNKELGELSQIVRAYESQESNFISDYREFIETVQQHKREIISFETLQIKVLGMIINAKKKAKKKKPSGTKKKPARSRAGQVKAKKVPRKKVITKKPAKKTKKVNRKK